VGVSVAGRSVEHVFDDVVDGGVATMVEPSADLLACWEAMDARYGEPEFRVEGGGLPAGEAGPIKMRL